MPAPCGCRTARAGLRTPGRATCWVAGLLAVASQSWLLQCLMTAFVPGYRCGTVPDSHRIPSCDDPPGRVEPLRGPLYAVNYTGATTRILCSAGHGRARPLASRKSPAGPVCEVCQAGSPSSSAWASESSRSSGSWGRSAAIPVLARRQFEHVGSCGDWDRLWPLRWFCADAAAGRNMVCRGESRTGLWRNW